MKNKTLLITIIAFVTSLTHLIAQDIDEFNNENTSKIKKYRYGRKYRKNKFFDQELEAFNNNFETLKFTDKELESISENLGLYNQQEIKNFLYSVKELKYNYGLIQTLISGNDNLDQGNPEVAEKIETAQTLSSQYKRVSRKISRLIRETSQSDNLKSFSNALKSTIVNLSEGKTDGQSFTVINEFELSFQYGEKAFSFMKENLDRIFDNFVSKTEL